MSQIAPNMESPAVVDPAEWMEEMEGQLAIDVYQSASDLIIKAPIAGVKQEDLDVSITDEKLTIRGERRNQIPADVEDYLIQECYWGAFSRTLPLPVAVDPDKTSAKLVDGILTVIIPKAAKARTRSITVELG